jgi:hypothetical protein
VAFGYSSKTEETKGMPLPQLNRVGALPEGVHQATMDEVLAQFGSGTSQRQAVTARLQRIYHLARATGKQERLILFGSYITAKPDPNDVDIILVMHDDFDVQTCDEESQTLFDHPRDGDLWRQCVLDTPSAARPGNARGVHRALADHARPDVPWHCGGASMIHNDQELQATQERIAYFQRLLSQLRVTATPAEFPLVASGYRAEVVRMQDEVLAYLTQHASEPMPAEVS